MVGETGLLLPMKTLQRSGLCLFTWFLRNMLFNSYLFLEPCRCFVGRTLAYSLKAQRTGSLAAHYISIVARCELSM